MSGPPRILASPVRLHSTRCGALTAAVRAFARALRAWREVSVSGAARAVRVADALLTLGEPVGQPAPRALAAVIDDAADALSWLRESAARLSRAFAGLREHIGVLRAEAKEDGDGDGAFIATVGLGWWVRVYEEAVDLLGEDLREKEAFLGMIDGVMDGLEALDRQRLQFGVETWLEMPCVRDDVVELVEAAFEAEVEAGTVLEAEEAAAAAMYSPVRDAGRKGLLSSSPAGTPQGVKSPAMAMLLGCGGGSSSKKKNDRG